MLRGVLNVAIATCRVTIPALALASTLSWSALAQVSPECQTKDFKVVLKINPTSVPENGISAGGTIGWNSHLKRFEWLSGGGGSILYRGRRLDGTLGGLIAVAGNSAGDPVFVKRCGFSDNRRFFELTITNSAQTTTAVAKLELSTSSPVVASTSSWAIHHKVKTFGVKLVGKDYQNKSMTKQGKLSLSDADAQNFYVNFEKKQWWQGTPKNIDKLWDSVAGGIQEYWRRFSDYMDSLQAKLTEAWSYEGLLGDSSKWYVTNSSTTGHGTAQLPVSPQVMQQVKEWIDSCNAGLECSELDFTTLHNQTVRIFHYGQGRMSSTAHYNFSCYLNNRGTQTKIEFPTVPDPLLYANGIRQFQANW